MTHWKKINLFFIGMLVGCLFFSIVPSVQGFMTFYHEFRRDFVVLIDKVHAPHWTISYSYSDDCPPEMRNNDAAITAAVTKALQTWLQPLRDYSNKPIVNDFRYQKLAAEPFRADSDLWIIFYCVVQNSTAHVGNRPGINLRQGTKVVQSFMDSLVHEAGHVFGLADTYVPWWDDRHKQGLSKGGLSGTKGTQPASVMSLHMPVFLDREPNDPAALDGFEPLGMDDINGIIWLYKYVYEQLPLEDCFFPEYALEKTPLGCRPKYPLIFEIKQGDEYWSLEVIKDDPNLDINAQDKDGMTALHYAVLQGFEELIAKLLDHPDIKPFLSDKQGRTALRIARERGLDKIIALLLSHPLTLAVDAKGKLTTTWGELKNGD